MALTLDIIEQRAKALGWQYLRRSYLGETGIIVETPTGRMTWFEDRGVAVRRDGRDSWPAEKDLATLESPEPARPVVDPVTGLLPCPFCGEKAEIYRVLEYHTDCLACGFGLSAALIDEARAAWNRRTP